MADRLATWCLASFNVALLTVAGVLAIHAFADLGPLLAGLDTLTGLALYVALWALALWTNGRALAGVEPGRERPPLMTVLPRALAWGGVTGAAFLWAIVALVYLPDAPGVGVIVSEGPEFLVILAIASAFAALVGALIALVLGALDLVLLRAVAVPDDGTPS